MDDEILKACDITGIRQLIESLSEGLDTKVNKASFDLSGGQKQRLMIARVLLKNPGVYIFDEATSDLDIDIEKSIVNEILGMGDESIVIIISHRLSSIKDCDRIIVMHDGYIENMGKHHELMETSEIYRDRFVANVNQDEKSMKET